MAIYAGVSKPEYSIENGTYPARLFQIIQLGSQRFAKNDKEWFSPQILLGFELPTLSYEGKDGETCNIKSGTYFLSMNPSRLGVVGLREIVDGLRGSIEYTEAELEQFDISTFLGKECEIMLDGVESKGQVYQNIVGVTPYTGTEKLPKFREPIMVEVSNFSNIEDYLLPTWIEDKIKMSKEYKEMSEAPLDHNRVDEGELRESADEALKNVPF